MAKATFFEIEIDGSPFRIKKYVESRRGARLAFGKDAIIYRVPRFLLPHQKREADQWFEKTLREKIQQNPDLKQQYQLKKYQTGDQIQVGERMYTLDISHTTNKSHSAKLKGGVISLKLVQGIDAYQEQKAIKTLLSRVIGKDFHPSISRRVFELNELYFKKPITSVKLKYNQSNWGSCSTKGNVNLSTRLLFAPDDVIDYVIIHELAHLIEMNHSPRFWKLVKDAMPDYKEKERWLKDNRNKCDF